MILTVSILLLCRRSTSHEIRTKAAGIHPWIPAALFFVQESAPSRWANPFAACHRARGFFLPGKSLLHRCIVQKMLQMRDCTLLADLKRRGLRTAAP